MSTPEETSESSRERPEDRALLGYFVPVSPRELRDDVDLQAVLGRVWRGRWIVIAAGLGFGILFFVIAMYSTRIYQAVNLVSIVRPDGTGEPNMGLGGQLGAIAAAAGLRAGSAASNREEFIAFLKSRQLQGKFIENAGLMGILYASQWDATTKKWKPGNEDSIPSLDEAVERLRDGVLKIEVDKLTGLVSVKFEWKSPRLVTEWATQYVNLANAEMRARMQLEAEKSLEYLNRELANTSSVAIQQAIFGLIQSQMNSKMLASVRQEYAYRTVDVPTEPDRDRFVKPRRVVYGVIGGFLGGFFASLFCVLRFRNRAAR
jgi:uncharacterized protein involved in exopolysaccharide biosynthesis